VSTNLRISGEAYCPGGTSEGGQAVRWLVKGTLPVRHSFALSSEGGKVAPDFGHGNGITHEPPKPRSSAAAFRADFVRP
jgi:hypothetical protein